MNLSVSPEDEIWFLCVCHHISNTVYYITVLRWRIIGLKNRFTFTENYFRGGYCPVEPLTKLPNIVHDLWKIKSEVLPGLLEC